MAHRRCNGVIFSFDCSICLSLQLTLAWWTRKCAAISSRRYPARAPRRLSSPRSTRSTLLKFRIHVLIHLGGSDEAQYACQRAAGEQPQWVPSLEQDHGDGEKRHQDPRQSWLTARIRIVALANISP